MFPGSECAYGPAISTLLTAVFIGPTVTAPTAEVSPSSLGYEVRFTKAFGENLYVPDPFGRTLGTTGFQAPGEHVTQKPAP
ncbi:hypothetical protein [Streptomyces sp. NPDC051636]|uniref:hypothetical protein n=1 Tax=Streptomyces sp. NPDC051636 TaxID=3365663 RepID=UPI00379C3646